MDRMSSSDLKWPSTFRFFNLQIHDTPHFTLGSPSVCGDLRQAGRQLHQMVLERLSEKKLYHQKRTTSVSIGPVNPGHLCNTHKLILVISGCCNKYYRLHALSGLLKAWLFIVIKFYCWKPSKITSWLGSGKSFHSVHNWQPLCWVSMKEQTGLKGGVGGGIQRQKKIK